MRELWLWRGVAAVALIGWAVTAWTGSDPPEHVGAPSVAAAPTVDGTSPERVPTERSERRRVRFAEAEGRDRSPSLRMPAQAADAAAPVPEDVMERARDQVRQEWRERRAARSEERLGEMLDGVGEFAAAHELDADAQGALEDAVIGLHQRMTALHAEDDGEHRGPPTEDRRARFRAAFDQLDVDVRAAVGDELADAFHDQMRPPDRRGGPPHP